MPPDIVHTRIETGADTLPDTPPEGFRRAMLEALKEKFAPILGPMVSTRNRIGRVLGIGGVGATTALGLGALGGCSGEGGGEAANSGWGDAAELDPIQRQLADAGIATDSTPLADIGVETSALSEAHVDSGLSDSLSGSWEGLQNGVSGFWDLLWLNPAITALLAAPLANAWLEYKKERITHPHNSAMDNAAKGFMKGALAAGLPATIMLILPIVGLSMPSITLAAIAGVTGSVAYGVRQVLQIQNAQAPNHVKITKNEYRKRFIVDRNSPQHWSVLRTTPQGELAGGNTGGQDVFEEVINEQAAQGYLQQNLLARFQNYSDIILNFDELPLPLQTEFFDIVNQRETERRAEIQRLMGMCNSEAAIRQNWGLLPRFVQDTFTNNISQLQASSGPVPENNYVQAMQSILGNISTSIDDNERLQILNDVIARHRFTSGELADPSQQALRTALIDELERNHSDIILQAVGAHVDQKQNFFEIGTRRSDIDSIITTLRKAKRGDAGARRLLAQIPGAGDENMDIVLYSPPASAGQRFGTGSINDNEFSDTGEAITDELRQAYLNMLLRRTAGVYRGEFFRPGRRRDIALNAIFAAGRQITQASTIDEDVYINERASDQHWSRVRTSSGNIDPSGSPEAFAKILSGRSAQTILRQYFVSLCSSSGDIKANWNFLPTSIQKAFQDQMSRYVRGTGVINLQDLINHEDAPSSMRGIINTHTFTQEEAEEPSFEDAREYLITTMEQSHRNDIIATLSSLISQNTGLSTQSGINTAQQINRRVVKEFDTENSGTDMSEAGRSRIANGAVDFVTSNIRGPIGALLRMIGVGRR
jgi:hypothetical protein